MGWKELKGLAGAVVTALAEGRPPEREWTAFQEAARATESAPPFHLRTLLDELARLTPDGARDRVAILDHGCGGGYTLLYLAALGWTNIHGVDVGGRAEALNRLTADILGLSGQRFTIYDGATLPLADDSIDLVFSQQVLEHVNPAVYDSYLREEARVLRPGGVAYHQVPQRLTPYESHTRTWLLHYLPLGAFRRAVDALGRGNEVSRGILFLRWPWQVRDDFRRVFGRVEDRTAARAAQVPDADVQEGSMALRRLIANACRAPLLGPLTRGALANLMMLDLVAVKTAQPGASER